ncbi:het domain containing protein [Colletotrichum musicola]|uniref:Het domain containing protein n=1 Tax=Colletotrichum musicola TaxID=2175873 RepID=A0A8H6K1V9_9PEZI|nr:het domain containing protein [Colletotrichum musicola]
MRLINTETYELEEFFDSERPPYAILSHTWGVDEVNLQEWEQWLQGDADTKARIAAKRGFKKIKKACGIARKGIPKSESKSKTKGESKRNTKDPEFRFLWVDTNCIDKKSSAEETESINSMFHWYQTASFCIVYLEDVGPGSDTVLVKSRWFTRGWTLQELIAPEPAENVIFYARKWHPIGSRVQLCDVLTSITGIPRKVLLEPGSY